MTGSLVVLTGASGSGKTTLAHAIKDRYPGKVVVLFFDSIGVPSIEEMKRWGHGYQPGGAWQRAMTLEWFDKLAGILNTGRSVLFEGQMRLAFIREGWADYLRAEFLEQATKSLIPPSCPLMLVSSRFIPILKSLSFNDRSDSNIKD